MATVTLTSKFDRAAIMRAAWATYRSIHERYAAWQIARGIVDGSFAAALRKAWAEAKKAARKAAALAGPHGDRIRLLQEQIEMLSYKSFRYNIAEERLVLREQIAMLEVA